VLQDKIRMTKATLIQVNEQQKKLLENEYGNHEYLFDLRKQQQQQHQQSYEKFEEDMTLSTDQSDILLKDHEMSICPRCQVYRPLDSHHCRICHKCIRNRHHHCQWINNCIGEFNQKYFIQFVFYISKYIFLLFSLNIFFNINCNLSYSMHLFYCIHTDIINHISRRFIQLE